MINKFLGIDFESALSIIADKVDNISLIIQKKIYILIDTILSVGEFSYKRLYFERDEDNLIIKNKLYKRLRLLTYPWHHIWIFGYWVTRKPKVKSLIYDLPGVHLLIGAPGSGKSSLMYHLAERIRIEFGKASYINSTFEKPRLSDERDYKYVYHRLFEFTDFWRDRRTVKKPNHMLFGAMFIDEAHRILNYRENGSSDYNDKFIPFIGYAVLVRKNIKKIYMSTQMGKVDTQLMTLAKTITEPRIDIGFDYPDWLFETGLFRLKILGWHIDQYGLDINGEKSKKPIKTFYIKNEYADFDYFDTMAMGDAYDHLKMDMPEHIVKGRIIT